MARQIEPRLGEPRLATLEERLSEVELRVAMLTEAVRVLARGLEGSPVDEPADGAAAEAARRARELLMGPMRR
ncbi:MAG: hypothetical protein ACM3ML_24035 [Micromonosporaceae bacterium]